MIAASFQIDLQRMMTHEDVKGLADPNVAQQRYPSPELFQALKDGVKTNFLFGRE